MQENREDLYLQDPHHLLPCHAPVHWPHCWSFPFMPVLEVDGWCQVDGGFGSEVQTSPCSVNGQASPGLLAHPGGWQQDGGPGWGGLQHTLSLPFRSLSESSPTPVTPLLLICVFNSKSTLELFKINLSEVPRLAALEKWP
ncbi:Hypothetical predicted protein [Marmota monax]|uniref:Uncharacterized protein n=1 Tax=Marmota monax TaxID=9995 RepID=A0A5E4B265_MARMO|nr:hypothetical protein GHT09_008271 [Marmota monax]VTJ62859.1 Hypothetical predicted protein [Marmota monax]